MAETMTARNQDVQKHRADTMTAWNQDLQKHRDMFSTLVSNIETCDSATEKSIKLFELRDLVQSEISKLVEHDTEAKNLAGKLEDPLDDTFSHQVLLGTFMTFLMYVKLYQFLNLGGPEPITAGFLATLSGILFFGFGKFLMVWAPTHRPGRILMERVLLCSRNWSEHTLRSFAEITVWLATIYCSLSLYGDIILSVIIGTASAATATLCSEYMTQEVKHRCTRKSKKAHMPLDFYAASPFFLPLAWMVIEFVQILIEHCTNILVALTLATLASAAFILAAELIASWQLTHQAGVVLINRWRYSPRNWIHHPLRSLCEIGIWFGAIFLMYERSRDIFQAVRFGTMVSVVTILTISKCYPCTERHSHCLKDIINVSIAPTTPKREPKRVPRSRTQLWTTTEIAKHNTPEDVWIVIENRVYDVTTWVPKHPGGDVILKFGGADASDQFAAFHQPHSYKRLSSFCIGVVEDVEPVSEITQDYRALRQYLWENGYFNPDRSYHVIKHVVVFTLLCASLFVGVTQTGRELVPLPPYGATFLSGLLMALFWQQVAFVAHDALHNSVVRPLDKGLRSWWNLLGWFYGSVLFGISAEKWKNEHNVHHACTLRPCEDPQFNYLPHWMQSMKELERYGGPYKLDKLTKFLVPIQHYTLLPLCIIVGRVNLTVEALIWSARAGYTKDFLGMLVYWCYYITTIYMLPGGFYHRLVFFVTTHFAIGTLHIQLLISHLATDVFTAKEELDMGFCTFQLRTSRNIETHALEHWFHGGLEFQIEHHLFPLLPRHNLQAIQPFVRELAAKHGLEYEEKGFFEAIIYCLQDFKAVAHALVHVHLD